MEQNTCTPIGAATSVAQIMQRHIRLCKISGQTVAAYCREQGLAASKFYYWQKQFKGRQPNPGFVQLETASISTAAVNIQFPNGVRVSFDNSIRTDVYRSPTDISPVGDIQTPAGNHALQHGIGMD